MHIKRINGDDIALANAVVLVAIVVVGNTAIDNAKRELIMEWA